MENKKTVSFDNINLLKTFIKEGKFSALTGNIKNLKLKMDALCKSARSRERELLATADAEKVEAQRAEQAKAIVEEQKAQEVKVEQKVEVKPQQVPAQKFQQNYQRPQNQQNQQRFNQSQGQFNRNQQQNNRNGFNRNNQGQGFNKFNKQGQNAQGQFNRNNNQQRPPFNKAGGLKTNIAKPKPTFVQPIIENQPQRDHANKKKGGVQYEEKKTYTKRDLLKRGMIEADNTEDRMLSRKVRTKKKEEKPVVVKPSGPAVITTDNITVKLLSEVPGKTVSEIMKKFML